MALKLAAALLVILLASCTQPAASTSDLIVDQCALEEYTQECEMSEGGENGTPERLAACITKARTEALRIRAGVRAPCLKPGAPVRLW